MKLSPQSGLSAYEHSMTSQRLLSPANTRSPRQAMCTSSLRIGLKCNPLYSQLPLHLVLHLWEEGVICLCSKTESSKLNLSYTFVPWSFPCWDTHTSSFHGDRHKNLQLSACQAEGLTLPKHNSVSRIINGEHSHQLNQWTPLQIKRSISFYSHLYKNAFSEM